MYLRLDLSGVNDSFEERLHYKLFFGGIVYRQGLTRLCACQQALEEYRVEHPREYLDYLFATHPGMVSPALRRILAEREFVERGLDHLLKEMLFTEQVTIALRGEPPENYTRFCREMRKEFSKKRY